MKKGDKIIITEEMTEPYFNGYPVKAEIETVKDSTGDMWITNFETDYLREIMFEDCDPICIGKIDVDFKMEKR